MKYIAKQIPPEHQDSEWREFINDDGRLFSVVSFDRCGIETGDTTKPFRRALTIMQAFPDCESRMNCWLDALVKEELYDTYAKEICEMRGQMRPVWQTARQAAKRAARDFIRFEQRRSDQIESAAKLLSAVTGIEFIVRDIRGCSQRDHAQLIIPKDECTEDAKDEIEARYFNTGDAWTTVDHDGNCYWAYTWGWNDEQKEKQIREQCDISDTDELEMYEFNGWTKTANYTKVS